LAFWFTPPMFKLLRRRGVRNVSSASALIVSRVSAYGTKLAI
jgi:hypothetical protein